MVARSAEARCVAAASVVVAVALSDTAERVCAMPWEALASSATLRLISLVVTDCSSTADAMVVWASATCP